MGGGEKECRREATKASVEEKEEGRRRQGEAREREAADDAGGRERRGRETERGWTAGGGY